jgi:hypothetical protein
MGHKSKHHEKRHRKHHKGSHRSKPEPVVDQRPADLVIEPFHAPPPPMHLLARARLDAVVDAVAESVDDEL